MKETFSVFNDVKREKGKHISGAVAIPIDATRLGFVADRKAWEILAGDNDLIRGSVEISSDGGETWIEIGAVTAKQSYKVDKLGNLSKNTSMSCSLPKGYIGIPLLGRVVIEQYGYCEGNIDFIIDDTPLPPKPKTEHKSVTYDTDGDNIGADVTSVTISAFEVADNADRYMIVGATAWDSVAADSLVSSVSHNASTAGWSIIKTELGPGVNLDRASLWGKVAPAVVTATVVVTVGGTCSELGACAISLYGVDQSTPLGTAVSAEGTTNPATVTVADFGSDDMLVDSCYGGFNTAPCVVGAGQTSRQNTALSSYSAALCSTQPGSTAGGVMSWTNTSFTEWVICAVAVKAVGAAVDENISVYESSTVAEDIGRAMSDLGVSVHDCSDMEEMV